MAEKRKGKKRKEEYVPPGEEEIDKPTKEEFAIAKWMRKNVPIKKTKFLNHVVEYFTARRAVDLLMMSKWAQGDSAIFITRDDVVYYLNSMLLHKFFHRARKVPVSEHELRSKKKEKKSASDSGNEKEKEKETKEKAKETKEKAKETKEKDKGTDAESSVVEGKQEAQPEKEKRKKKIRLDMHNDQRFVDGLDAYVWIYDPIPFHYWIIGALLVLGAIGICLFPLWPPSVRLGVYYLSVAGAFFLAFIIVLTILRHILFCLIWLVTLGKHHLWILPNLTEDVGFFASFLPLYQYEYKGDAAGNKKDKKKKKDKCCDMADDPPYSPHLASLQCQEKPSEHQDIDEGNGGDIVTEEAENQAEQNPSESESESSQRSSTGKDFEIVDREDLDS